MEKSRNEHMVANFLLFIPVIENNITSLEDREIKLFSIKNDDKIGKEEKKQVLMLKGPMYMYFEWWLLKNNSHVVLFWWQT